MVGDILADARTRKNGRHALARLPMPALARTVRRAAEFDLATPPLRLVFV